MGERDEDGPREDTSSEAKKKNDSTIALSESEFLALQVPGASPPAVPTTPRPAPAPAISPAVSRNDASMWAGSVMVADEFEPLVVPRRPLGRWLFLALFVCGLAGAALYFLWWQPSHDVAGSEETPADTAAAAKPAEAGPVAPEPTPPPAGAQDPAAQPAPPPAVAPEEKPAAAPVKKTASKKTASKKKTSKKKTSKRSKKKRKRTRRSR